MPRKQQLGPTLEAVLGLDASRFYKGLLKVDASLVRMQKRMRAIGTKMTAMITVPLVGMAAAAVHSFSKFDDTMTRSTAIMGNLSDTTVRAMRETAVAISDKGITSASELADSYFFLASAGMNAQQAMASLSTVETFATAGAFDMATATDLLTDAQTALGLQTGDTEKDLENLIALSNSLVSANVQSNASVRQFSEALTNDAATAAGSFGTQMNTVLAVLDAYATKGKKGAEAGSMFGRAVRLLSRAYNDNAKEFKRMGIAVVDDDGNYRNFISIIQDIERALKGMSQSERTAELDTLGFAALAQKAILPLIGMSDKMKDWEKELNEGLVTSIEVADKQMKSFGNQMKILKNQFVHAGSAIGASLVPMIESAAAKMRVWLKQWKDLDQSTKTFILKSIAVTAAIGPVTLAFSGLTAAVHKLWVALNLLVTHPVIAALAAIAAEVIWLTLKYREAHDAVTEFDVALSNMASKRMTLTSDDLVSSIKRMKQLAEQTKVTVKEKEELRRLTMKMSTEFGKGITGDLNAKRDINEYKKFQAKMAVAQQFKSDLQARLDISLMKASLEVRKKEGISAAELLRREEEINKAMAERVRIQKLVQGVTGPVTAPKVQAPGGKDTSLKGQAKEWMKAIGGMAPKITPGQKLLGNALKKAWEVQMQANKIYSDKLIDDKKKKERDAKAEQRKRDQRGIESRGTFSGRLASQQFGVTPIEQKQLNATEEMKAELIKQTDWIKEGVKSGSTFAVGNT